MTTKTTGNNSSTKESLKGLYPRRGESYVALQPPTSLRTEAQVASTDLSEIGEAALLWPGHEVRVAEHAVDGVIVKSVRRIKPGTRTNLQLLGNQRSLSGAIEWCRVTRLEPLCFDAAFVFDQTQDLPEVNNV